MRLDLEFYPWQLETAQQWLSQKDRLAHAWLLHGLAGIGKRQFGLALAASLLCEKPQHSLACGQCQACLWVRLGNHPDLMRVRPEAMAVQEALEDEAAGRTESTPKGSAATKKPSEHIRLEQIRALEPWYHRSTHRGHWRIVLLYPAQALLAESANALLKSLEEPPANTLFLLITDAPDRLLPTILSRCQRRTLVTPSADASVAWLKTQGLDDPLPWLAMSGGAPLRALTLSRTLNSACPPWILQTVTSLAQGRVPNLTTLVDELITQPASDWLDALQRLAIDLCLCCAGLEPRYFVQQSDVLVQLAQRRSLASWIEWQRLIAQQTRLAHHPLNARLFARSCLQQLTETANP